MLSSCAHPLPFQSSQVNPPSMWNKMSAVMIADEDKVKVDQRWWWNFKDLTLSELVQEAVANNKTLGIAHQRILEAQANLGYARAAQMPEIDGVVNPRRQNQGYATARKPVNLVDVQLQATWEMDIFQRNTPRMQQAEELVQYAQYSRQAVVVDLLSALGESYFDLQNYKLQMDITVKNLDLQRQTLKLIKAQLKGAMASDFDVQRTEAQVSATESKLPALQTAYDAALDQINVLLGAAPGTKDVLIEKREALQPLDQRILVAAPATVLANRPDVKAAERQFAAAISGKKAAQRLYWPDINLLSFFGLQGSHMPTAETWGAALTIVEPLIDFGRIRAQINAADAQQQEAFLNYQQTVLGAMQQMEDALSSYKNEWVRNQSLRKAVEQNRRASDLAQRQFKSGFIGLLDVLVVQGNLLEAESTLADSDCTLRKDLVHVYVASGGGWQTT